MRKLTFLFVLLIPILTKAQEKLAFKVQDELVEFEISKEYYLIEYDSDFEKLIKQKSNAYFSKISENHLIIRFSEGKNLDYSESILALKNEYGDKITDIEPVLIYKDGIKQACNNEIIIKFSSKIVLESLFKDYPIEYKENKFVKNQFLIKIFNINTFELFNLISVY